MNFRKLFSCYVLAVLLMFGVTETQASESFAPWLVRADFESALSYAALTWGECPISDEELNDLVSDEFLRARLKRANSLTFFLQVEIHCWSQHYLNGETAGTAIFSSVGFSSLTDFAKGSIDYSKHSSVRGLQTGADHSEILFLKSILREEVSSTIAQYLRANARN